MAFLRRMSLGGDCPPPPVRHACKAKPRRSSTGVIEGGGVADVASISIFLPPPENGRSMAFRVALDADPRPALKRLREGFDPSWGVVGVGEPLCCFLGKKNSGSAGFSWRGRRRLRHSFDAAGHLGLFRAGRASRDHFRLVGESRRLAGRRVRMRRRARHVRLSGWARSDRLRGWNRQSLARGEP